MCATDTTQNRVRWGGLYAIVLAAFAATSFAATSLPGGWAVGITVVIFAVAGIGTMRYLAMQRVALDLSDWCDCAASMLTIRVVVSEHHANDSVSKEEKTADERAYATSFTAVGETRHRQQ
jgi:hypothetical protein